MSIFICAFDLLCVQWGKISWLPPKACQSCLEFESFFKTLHSNNTLNFLPRIWNDEKFLELPFLVKLALFLFCYWSLYQVLHLHWNECSRKSSSLPASKHTHCNNKLFIDVVENSSLLKMLFIQFMNSIHFNTYNIFIITTFKQIFYQNFSINHILKKTRNLLHGNELNPCDSRLKNTIEMTF